MIIQCDKCATRFRLDDSRVTGQGVKVRCTKCQNVFLVTPPPSPPSPVDEAHVEEKAPASSRPQAKKEERPAEAKPRPAAKKPADNETLRFDFEKPPESNPEDSRVDAAGISGEKKPAPAPPDTSFAPDFGPKAENEASPAVSDPPTSGRKSHFEDIDFGISGEKSDAPPSEGQTGDTGGWDIGTGEAENKEKPLEQKLEMPSAQTPASVKGAEAAVAPPAPSSKEDKTGKFDEILASISEGGMEPGKNAAAQAPPAHAARSGIKYYVIAGAVVLAAAATFYFTGGVGMVSEKFAGKFLSNSSAAQHEETVRIDTVRGFFVDNKNIGRVFVIEAWIKNLSDSPQDIKEVRGVLYNNRGERIKTQSVSPGRVISLDDIKNLSREDILKQYRDVSGGTVPPKGAVPVTIVFVDIPKGMAEYGIDIVRNRS